MLSKARTLLVKAFQRAHGSSVVPKRKLYTDQIYPYPHQYISNTKYPSQYVYRENFIEPADFKWDARTGKWCMRAFWFYFFIHLLNDPGVMYGHHHYPNPEKWTDAELGVPPPEAGSYYDWLRAKLGDKEEE